MKVDVQISLKLKSNSYVKENTPTIVNINIIYFILPMGPMLPKVIDQ